MVLLLDLFRTQVRVLSTSGLTARRSCSQWTVWYIGVVREGCSRTEKSSEGRFSSSYCPDYCLFLALNRGYGIDSIDGIDSVLTK
jgi:hypothetical protein